MNALALVAAASTHGLLALLLWVLIAIVVLGVIYYVASLVLPHPWPTVIALIVGLVILLWALDAAA